MNLREILKKFWDFPKYRQMGNPNAFGSLDFPKLGNPKSPTVLEFPFLGGGGGLDEMYNTDVSGATSGWTSSLPAPSPSCAFVPIPEHHR